MNIHVKTAFDYIKRSPFQAIAALFVLTLTFFVATSMAVLIYASGKSLKYFETRPQIISFLKKEASGESISALQNKLALDNRIKDVRYVPKEEALEIYKRATEDNPLLAELVSPDIFPASLEFSVNDLAFAQNVIDEVKADPIVDQVGFTASLSSEKSLDNVVTRLKTIAQYVRVGGLTLVAVLSLTSFLVLLVIISMRMATRKSEVEILNLIGSTSGFIKNPIIL
jgi:cell division transport system permease protein